VTPTWPIDGYARVVLPERVLQFGTGMLLRAVSAVAVDTANRAGAFDGRIVVVQSTRNGAAQAINDQDGLFTLAEQGIEQGEPVRRTRLIGSISRALVADIEWNAVRAVAARPELRVIVSNVTEAGFRLDEREPPFDGDESAAPRSFPAKLTDLLFTRFTHLPDGPSLLVIPTELVAGNGPIVAAMVDQLARNAPGADAFRGWIAERVHFCSSLVDRITTRVPPSEAAAEFAARLGYHDALLTVAEPHSLWAIEGDPELIREVFPVDGPSGGAVILAPNIAPYRDRKLRMLNGVHTALAPYALMLKVRTVRDAVEHPTFSPLLLQLLFKEIVPVVPGPIGSSEAYARSVIERFANPYLDHEWRVIATNQTAKLRERVVPTLIDYVRRVGALPDVLRTMFAVSLIFACDLSATDGVGWWSEDGYRIVDADRHRIYNHWRPLAAELAAHRDREPIFARFAESVLADAGLWGEDLRAVPGLVESITEALLTIQPRDS
jgi:tagaturonate reductase